MASYVRLAARTPARRATSSTPPLARRPTRASRMAAAETWMRPRATASRRVTGLAETSTMRAAPRASRWVRGPEARLRGTVALQEVAEQQGGDLLSGLGPELARLENDEGVGLRVRDHVRRT